MNPSAFRTPILAFALLLSGQAGAQEPQPPAAAVPAKPKPAPKPKRKRKANKLTNKYKGKLIEINSAGKAELKTLPGITDALADKIIASRPFYSKAKLNDGILPAGLYYGLKDKVMCAPPGLPNKAK